MNYKQQPSHRMQGQLQPPKQSQHNAHNTNMLIFYDSDEEDSIANKKKAGGNLQNYPRQRAIKPKGRETNPLRTPAAQLRPSLMNIVQDDVDEYEPIALQQTKGNRKQQRQVLIKQQESQIVEVKVQTSQKADLQLNNQGQQNQTAFDWNNPPLFVQQFQKEQYMKVHDLRQQNNLLIEFQAESAQPNVGSKQSQRKQDILALDETVRKQSLYFESIVNSAKDQQQIIDLMLKPIIEHTKQIFLVYVSSAFIGKIFEFTIESGPSLKLLMRAQRSLGFNQTSYKIEAYSEYRKQFFPLCTMQSDSERRQYSIVREGVKREMLGTIVNRVTVKKDRYLILYYPRIIKINQPEGILHQSTQSLYEEFQEKQGKNVDFIITTRFTEEQQKQCMTDYGFRTSGKSMEFKGSKGELKLIIGKKQSKKYGLIAGSGLTPVQIFCVSIVNIEL